MRNTELSSRDWHINMFGVTAVGSKISTRIKQAGFDPLNVEALMYMGEQVVPMYTHALKKSTWSQLGWNFLGQSAGENDFETFFNINGFTGPSVNSIDYLLAFALDAIFPRITLVNTQAPVPFTVAFFPEDGPTPTVEEVQDTGVPLFFYLSDGTAGLPSGTVYVGTFVALTSATAEGGLGISPALVFPFVSYAPRHQVGWGHFALLAAIERVIFMIDGVDYEEMTREALFNAIQFRQREDVYPVAGLQATSLDAVLLPAGVGTMDAVVLGDPIDEQRYKGFVVPFSFTTSALTCRGENGKHKSAFPVLLACRNNIQVRVDVINDLRRILVLMEEVLPDYSTSPVVFVATPAELGVGTDGVPTNNMFITDGTTLFEIPGAGFLPSAGLTGYYATTGTYSVINVTAGTTLTYSPLTPFRVADFGVFFLEQTGEYLPVTRLPTYSLVNPFSRDVNYADWIAGGPFALRLRGQALSAVVTDLERGMMKKDCRSKKWLYDRYTYYVSAGVAPGNSVNVEINDTFGQTKYGYTFAQNEISRLQGNYFNYTNDTNFEIIMDPQLFVPKMVFPGRDSLTNIATRIQGFRDEDHNVGFYRYIDNPLVAQREPRDHGLHIAPRYNNFINAIYPDGSINATFTDARVLVQTTPSALVTLDVSPLIGQINTYAYNVYVIIVSWNIAIFELVGASSC